MTISIARVLTQLRIPIPVALGGTGKTTEFRKGFIDGLRMVYTGRQSLTVTVGSAYLSSSSKIVELSADKVLTGLTLTASSMHHVYLFENAGVGDIEISQTEPIRQFGTAYIKTGDSSRRYVGSVLAGPTAAFFGFRHDVQQGHIIYTEGTPGSAPFTSWSSYNNATPVLVSTVAAQQSSVCIAPRATALELFAVSSHPTGAQINFSPADQIAAPGSSNWGTAGSFTGVMPIAIPLSRTPATAGQFYIWTSGSVNTYMIGYSFER